MKKTNTDNNLFIIHTDTDRCKLHMSIPWITTQIDAYYVPNSKSFTSEAALSPSARRALSIFFERSIASLSLDALTAQPIVQWLTWIFRSSIVCRTLQLRSIGIFFYCGRRAHTDGTDFPRHAPTNWMMKNLLLWHLLHYIFKLVYAATFFLLFNACHHIHVFIAFLMHGKFVTSAPETLNHRQQWQHIREPKNYVRCVYIQNSFGFFFYSLASEECRSYNFEALKKKTHTYIRFTDMQRRECTRTQL